MAKQSVIECLDKLENIIESSPKVPISGKRIVDSVEILEFIDEIRIALPEEIRQAQVLIEERNRISAESQGPAAARPVMPGEEELASARDEASRILEDAKREACQICYGADDYAESTLSALEETLDRTISVVHKGVEELKRRKSGDQE